MGALDEGHYGLKLGGSVEVDFEQEAETIAIEDAVKVLLQSLGEDINREGLRKTPLRVAKALREGTRGYKQKVKDIIQGALFPEAGVENGVGQAGGSGGLVLVRDLDLYSYCESCLLPFQVKCHVGYIPSGQRVVGLSKLSRVADVFAKRLQDPQRLADEICVTFQHAIKPTGVAVILHCSHIHFPNFESPFLDSNHQKFVKVLVSSGSGSFEKQDSPTWVDFIGLLRYRDIDVERIRSRNSVKDSWCPSRSFSKIDPSRSLMVTAVSSILRSLGQDPCRKELVGTPNNFVRWITKFKDSNLEMELSELTCIPLRTTIRNFKDSNLEMELSELTRTPLRTTIGNFKEHIRSEVNLSLWSLCEHHLLPFYGFVHIGYISDEEVNPKGKSVLQSIVHFHGFKLQVQERLTRQIAEKVAPLLGGDVMVVVEANHTCMISRGIEKFGSNTATIAVLGRFLNDSAARTKFLQGIPRCSL